jgi:hypothetical protein
MRTNIFQLPDTDFDIFYDSAFGWGCEVADGRTIWFQQRENVIPLGPLLALRFEDASSLIRTAIRSRGLSTEIFDKFPLEDLVVCGLEWPTPYWVSCAFEWIKQGFPLNKRVVDALRSIPQNKRFPQRLRHEAFATVRRWDKGRTQPHRSHPSENPSV